MQIKQVTGKKVTFEDPVHIHAQDRQKHRPVISAKQPGDISQEDIWKQNEMILDALEDMLANK